MTYNKILIDNDGEEYPYSESFDDESYYYQISIVYDGRDGELNILKPGIHIVFDDDESWLDFNVAPEEIFPNKSKLTEIDLLKLISILETSKSKLKTYSKKEMDEYYKKFLQEKNKF